MENKKEKKVYQTIRVKESTKDAIEKVSKYIEDNNHVTKSYPSTVAGMLIDNIFSTVTSMDDVIEEIKKLKEISLKVKDTL